jgi:hypothetical protein
MEALTAASWLAAMAVDDTIRCGLTCNISAILQVPGAGLLILSTDASLRVGRDTAKWRRQNVC